VAGLAGFVFRVYAGPLKLPTVGRINNDSISLLIGAGATLALVEATRTKRRWWVAGAAIVCLAGPFSGTQRANYLALAGTVGVLVVAALSAPWRRRVKTTPTEALGLFGAMAIAGIAMFTFGGNQVNVVAKVDDTFFGSTEQATTDSRLSLWSEGWARIEQKPLLGWGLGIRDTVQMRGFTTEAELTSHNIALDVATRTGIIGFALLVTALGLTLAQAWRVWKEHPNDQLAALAVAMAAIIGAFVGKGMVESTFEKFRLSIGLGLAAGVILALHAQLRALQPDDSPTTRRVVDHLGRVPVEV
jgi:O-antigen ligase